MTTPAARDTAPTGFSTAEGIAPAQTASTEASIRADRPEPGVTRITFCRPERMNTADIDFVAQLKAALAEVDADLDTRVLVLTGQGRAFCAGLNLTGYGDEDLIDEQGLLPRAMGRQKEIADLVARIRGLRVPVIAAVNGATAGVGLSILCASDVRYAVPDANFAVGYIRAGFSACDMGLSWLLPRIIGAARAQELMLTGRRFTPAEAASFGLLAAVVEPDELMDRALETARQIMLNAPISVEFTKEGLWKSLEIPSFEAAVEFENRQQIYTALTEDRAEATASFLEKRAPVYRRR
ncbi:enoyl-CoA hydratase/isomerase family protein [Brevibacterium daeguense]|uniref:Enoyl-CoA hydratase/isomerase family protein n=1 Tax=Brevibacterium daeguense TaxID=909936 RepID=A0ABP8EK83_9MICO|nr:enoyl-CoA hydratase/isomerase family protein [Brevibacterium daeguense]